METSRPASRTVLASILRDHRRTTGMAVAMGETCRCGAWLRGETHYKDEPRWHDDLAQHQADEILKALEQNDPSPTSDVGPSVPTSNQTGPSLGGSDD